ncbi:MAG: esterase-like activity of phytase family protein [Caulobacteraceae bacterium]
MRRVVLASLAALLAACVPSHSSGSIEQWQAVQVTVIPIDAGVESVGRLAYRGGFELQSRDPTFVGLSGIEVLDNGRIVAVSDEADWIEAQLVFDERGYLAGFTNVRSAWMRDDRGQPIRDKAQGDSEGLAQLPDGRFAVSFERTHVIRIYDFNRDGPFGAPSRGPRLDGVSRLPANASLEALAAFDGALLAGAEGGEEGPTQLWLAPLDASSPVAARFSYPLHDGFSLTGLDRLPDGGFVAVERFYAPVIGPRARITRLAAPSGEGGAVEPELLALLETPFPVDNFEGVSAVRGPDGATRIYVVSDNNNSVQQRTLLLAFDIVETQAD